MDKWKVIALVSIGFSVGVVYAWGAGGASASGWGSGRAVVELTADTVGSCATGHNGWTQRPGCSCPTGFTWVGWRETMYATQGDAVLVCLEN